MSKHRISEQRGRGQFYSYWISSELFSSIHSSSHQHSRLSLLIKQYIVYLYYFVVMESELVISIATESIQTKRSGYLTVYRLSDTIYSVQYQDAYEYITVDIDSVHVDVKRQIVYFHEPQEQDMLECSFFVADRRHLQLFHDAQRECQQVCNLALEIASRLRDVYYAGVYQHVNPEDPILLSDELPRLQGEAVDKFLRQGGKHDHLPASGQGSTNTASSTAASTNPHHSTALGSNTSPNSSSALPNSQLSNNKHVPRKIEDKLRADAKCFYCFTKYADNAKFYIHPYVSKNFQKKAMVMCEVCMENWKDYREHALAENQLILEGEINEEICALCSDTPSELVLCSCCQRSFCDGCLQKILAEKEYTKVRDPETNWRCFSCFNKLDLKPLLTKGSWKYWKPESEEKSRVISSTADGKPSPVRHSRAIIAKPSSSERKKTDKPQLDLGDEKDLSVKIGKEFVPPILSGNNSPLIVVANSVVTNKKKDKKDKASDVHKTTAGNGLDETYYFGQYLTSLEDVYKKLDSLVSTNSKSKSGNKSSVFDFPTDEVCFLCKDGGEVIECDYCVRSKIGHRCLKVYHSYCLDFEVQDNVEWCCPRHFCSGCGAKQLKYICMFCPISICGDCTGKYTQMVSELS